MFRVIAAFDDDGAVESVSQHVLKAIDLEIILSLLAKLYVQSAGAVPVLSASMPG